MQFSEVIGFTKVRKNIIRKFRCA